MTCRPPNLFASPQVTNYQLNHQWRSQKLWNWLENNEIFSTLTWAYHWQRTEKGDILHNKAQSEFITTLVLEKTLCYEGVSVQNFSCSYCNHLDSNPSFSPHAFCDHLSHHLPTHDCRYKWQLRCCEPEPFLMESFCPLWESNWIMASNLGTHRKASALESRIVYTISFMILAKYFQISVPQFSHP